MKREHKTQTTVRGEEGHGGADGDSITEKGRQKAGEAIGGHGQKRGPPATERKDGGEAKDLHAALKKKIAHAWPEQKGKKCVGHKIVVRANIWAADEAGVPRGRNIMTGLDEIWL